MRVTASAARGIRLPLIGASEDVHRDDNFDEKALVERIRQHLGEQLASAPQPVPPRRPEPAADASDGIAAELRAMANSCDVADVPVRSYRAVLGPALNAARTVARKLFAGALERQASYNAANLRLVSAYERELEELRRRCDALEATIRELRAKIGD